MNDVQQRYRIRLALARKAHDDDVVRLVDRDLSGFEHVAATRDGLIAVGPGGFRLLAHGQFYGLSVLDGALYAFEACDRPRTPSQRGRIVRFDIRGGRIEDAKVLARGLDNGCHQIDFIGDRLYVTDTYNQRLLQFAKHGGDPVVLHPLPRPTDGTREGYVHVNSLLAHGPHIYLLQHNDGAGTGRDSDIAVFDRDWQRQDTIPLAGQGCHSLAVLEDGTVLSCGSLAGELVCTDGWTIKVSDRMTRGLSVDDRLVVVGGSLMLEREARDGAAGEVYFLDRAYRRLATVAVPGSVMEIRRIDGRDRSLSNHLAQGRVAAGSARTAPRARAFAAARRGLTAVARYLRSADAWSELATRFSFPGEVHQDITLSWPDRYPRLTAAVAELLRDNPAPRLLSFGCAAGEEVLSLQRAMPGATVVGAELNRAKLRECRRLPADPDLSFIASTPANIAAAGPYDAIFCMAVLTRRPHEVAQRELDNIADFYPFARFADQVRLLVEQLRDGGLLVVEHSLYRVEDMMDELGIVPVPGPGTFLAKGPRFDRNGARVQPQPIVARIFRKGRQP